VRHNELAIKIPTDTMHSSSSSSTGAGANASDRVESHSMLANNNGSIEMDSLVVSEAGGHDDQHKPFLNVDVLYLFQPMPGFRNIKCYSHKSLTAPVQCTVVARVHVLLNQKKDNWSYLISGRDEGWVKLDESYFGPNGPLTRVETFRKYEIFPGRARFLFGGRVMLGSDARMFLLTNILYIATMMLAAVAVFPNVSNHAVYAVSTRNLTLFLIRKVTTV
jgi:hypothetical protein